MDDVPLSKLHGPHGISQLAMCAFPERYPLLIERSELENHHAINGTTHVISTGPCSTAM